MGTSDPESMLQQAMAAVNAGDLVQGRALLESVLEQDPNNDWAWVWLSGCVEDPLQRRICLQQALKANPENPAALDGIRVLDGELVQAASVAPSLLESRLAAIGMGEVSAAAPPTASPPTPDYAASPSLTPGASPAVEVDQPADRPEAPRRRRVGFWIVLFLAVFVLAVVVCGLVVWLVALPLVSELGYF
jgi:hypothetical protein